MPDILVDAGRAWLRQAGGGFGPLFAVAAVLFIVQRWTQASLAQIIGWRGIAYWTGWIGTPIHELSHLIVGKLFGVRIIESRLFAPDPESGVLGYVRYRIPRLRLFELHQVVGVFLMGIAPLFGGALALYGVRRLLVDPEADQRFVEAVHAFSSALSTAPVSELPGRFVALVGGSFRPLVIAGASEWRVWLYVYLSIAIGSHLAPSWPDLRGGFRGFVLLAVLGLAANVGARLAGVSTASVTMTLAEWTAPLTALLVLALILNTAYGTIVFVVAQLRAAARG